MTLKPLLLETWKRHSEDVNCLGVTSLLASASCQIGVLTHGSGPKNNHLSTSQGAKALFECAGTCWHLSNANIMSTHQRPCSWRSSWSFSKHDGVEVLCCEREQYLDGSSIGWEWLQTSCSKSRTLPRDSRVSLFTCLCMQCEDVLTTSSWLTYDGPSQIRE